MSHLRSVLPIVLSAASLAATPLQIDLNQTQADVTIMPDGEATELGGELAIGDVNGDGVDDLVAAAPATDAQWFGGVGQPGRIYVVFGSSAIASGHQLDLSTQPADVTLIGHNDGLGLGVGLATGDINGDGIDDILASAPLDIAEPYSRIYVLYGRVAWPDTVDLNVVDADVTVKGSWTVFGSHLAASDINGDGFDDLLAHTPFFVLLGGAALPSFIDLDDPGTSADIWVDGISNNGMPFGRGIASGDINDDGTADLLLGLGGRHNVSQQTAMAHVLFGRGSFPQHMEIGTDADVTIHGESLADNIATVAVTTDFDGDDVVDMVFNSEPLGRMYVVRGGVGLSPLIDLQQTSPHLTLTGPEWLGWSLAAGDLNGDGRGDLLIGARSTVYGVYGGGHTGQQDVRLAGADLIIAGESMNEFGWSVAVGDLNDDGVDDAIMNSMSAPNWTPPWLGGIYVLFGTAAPQPEITVTTGTPDLSLDLKRAHVGGQSTATFAVANEGNGDLVVSDITSSATQFAAAPTAFTLAPGEQQDVTVTFAPDAEGMLSASLTIMSNDPDEATVILATEATGVSPLTERHVDLSTTTPALTVLGGASWGLGEGTATADVDGDGDDDLLVSRTYQGDAPENAEGEVYLIYGGTRAAGSTVDLAQTAADVVIRWYGNSTQCPPATCGNQLMRYVLGVDLTGDGRAEVVTATKLGTHIIAGSASLPNVIDLAAPTVPVVILDAGFLLATGDVNGDGRADLVGGRAGQIFVVLGRADLMSAPPTAADVIISSVPGLTGSSPEGSPLTVGDVNGDGFDDIIYGSASGVYAVYGAAQIASRDHAVDGPDLTISYGGFPLNLFGHDIAAGDVNGDGIDDVVVGYFGRTSVVYGANRAVPSTVNLAAGAADVTIKGDQATVAGCHDINGDGWDDVLLTLSDFAFAGEYHVAGVYGRPAMPDSVDLNSEWADYAVYPLHGSPMSNSVTAGDVDGDGAVDLVFGTWGPAGRLNDGALLVIAGVDAAPPPLQPDIALDATAFSFGDVVAGDTATRFLTVTNNGTATLTVSSLASSDAAFAVTPTSLSVPAGEGRTATVTFTPSAASAYTASLTVASNDPDEASLTVVLSGNGLPPSQQGWTHLDLPVPDLEDAFYRIARDPQNDQRLYAVAGPLLRSEDGGDTWSELHSGWGGGGDVGIDPSDPQVIYMAGMDGLHKSQDGGVTWSQIYSYPHQVSRFRIHPTDPQILYTNTMHAGNLYRSGDGGATWANTQVPSAGIRSEIEIPPLAPLRVYASIGGVGWTSTDNGLAWLPWAEQLIPHGQPARLEALAYHPQEVNTVLAGLSNGSTGLHKSADGGVTWTSYPFFSSLNVYAIAFDPVDPSRMYVSAATPGASWAERQKDVYRTQDGGATWEALGLTQSYTGMILVTSGAVYASTASGVYRYGAVTPPPAGPRIEVSPLSLAFGDVDVGLSSVLPLTVRNPGTAPLAVTSIVSSGPRFAVSPTSLAVAVGDSAQVQVTYAPDAPGAHQDTLTFTSTDSLTPRLYVLVSGTGVGAVPRIAVSDSVLAFGPVRVDSSRVKALKVYNRGGATLAVTGLATSDSAFTVSTDGLALLPGDSTEVTVTYLPRAEQADAATLTLTSNDPVAPDFDVSLTGTGLGPSPRIALSDTVLAFGPLEVGASTVRQLTVSNLGDAVLAVTSIASSDSHFAVSPSAMALLPGASEQVTITYAPTAVQAYTGVLTLSSDDPLRPTAVVVLSGQGAAAAAHVAVSDSLLDFGTVTVSAGGRRLPLGIHNTGGAVLAATSISTSDSHFVVSRSSLALLPGDSTRVNVIYAPTTTQLDTAVLALVTNDPQRPTLRVGLRGTGVSAAGPEIAVYPASLTFPSVALGSSSSAMLRVANRGTQSLAVSDIAADDVQFTVNPTSLTVAAGDSSDVTVSFAPAAAGSHTATLTLISDDASDPQTQVPLSGWGAAPADSMWTVMFVVANAGAESDSLTFGLAAGASSGIDTAATYGELELPPKPPVQVFDARFQVAGSNGTTRSLLDLAAYNPLNAAAWTVEVQSGAGGYPLTLTWDPASLPTRGTLRLTDVFGGVLGIDVDMSAQASLTIDNAAITSVKIVYTPAAQVAPVTPNAFRVDVLATDAGSGQGTLTLGLDAQATAGVDTALGEQPRPPVPPIGSFDVRFVGPLLSSGLWLDLRDATSTSEVWTADIQPSSAGYPVTLAWDPGQIPTGATLELSDAFNGLFFQVDMAAQSQLVIDNSAITRVLFAYAFGSQSITYDLSEGWNLVSLPVAVTDSSLGALFPDALSAFHWQNQMYGQVQQMTTCVGYWVNQPQAGTYAIEGTPVATCTNDLDAGWQLIGGPSGTVPLASLGQNPTGVVLSVFRWFGQMYQQVTQFESAWGYWVNMTGPGVLTLTPGAAARPAAPAPTWPGGMLWAEAGGVRQEIRLGVAPDQVVELPPRAPAPLLDVRVAVAGRETWDVPASAEGRTYPVSITGRDVRLGWDVPASSRDPWWLRVGDEEYPLDGAGSLSLAEHPGQVRLVQGPSSAAGYALLACYPNPFNPSTTIRYHLGGPGMVRLRIYDTLGQKVRELVSEMRPAGQHSVVWDGRNDTGVPVANGVYLYQIESGDFSDLGKAVLMK